MSLQFIPVIPSSETIVPFIVWGNYYYSIEIIYTTVYSHHPISRAYCPLNARRNRFQSIISSAETSIYIILSPHQNSLNQLLCTPSADPINNNIASPHQNILLKFIYRHPISRAKTIRFFCHPIS